MALPTSGPLSFSMIAGELGVGTPFSLRNMSSNAGFGTPDGVSDFYGYSCGGGGLTLFFRSDERNGSFKTCGQQCCIPAWHTGSNPLPIIGDTVYNDAAGKDPLQQTFAGGFYGMSDKECLPADNWFYIDNKNPGKVVDWGNCLLQEEP